MTSTEPTIRCERLSDIPADRSVRITCAHCGFEEDWVPSELLAYVSSIGASDRWSDIAQHIRCRRFECGAAGALAHLVSRADRTANLRRKVSRLDAHLIATALTVLDGAAANACGRRVATIEVRLALLVVHRYSRDHDSVKAFWTRASADNRSIDDGLIEPLRVIRERLETAGWLAPAVLLAPARHWPWHSPAPPGWVRPRTEEAPVEDHSANVDASAPTIRM